MIEVHDDYCSLDMYSVLVCWGMMMDAAGEGGREGGGKGRGKKRKQEV